MESFYGNHLSARGYHLAIRQQPLAAKRFLPTQKKEPRPIDPFPIIQLTLSDGHSHAIPFDANPAFIMYVSLVQAGSSDEEEVQGSLSGNLCSSMHRLKDLDGSLGGYFVFPDLYAAREGNFRLRFTLYELEGLDSLELPENVMLQRGSILSSAFHVYSAKAFPGMSESTALSRLFADQGLKIRVRKESRASNYKKRVRETDESVSNEQLYSGMSEKQRAMEGRSYAAPPLNAFYPPPVPVAHHGLPANVGTGKLSPTSPLSHQPYSYYPPVPPPYAGIYPPYHPGSLYPYHPSQHPHYHPSYWASYPPQLPPSHANKHISEEQVYIGQPYPVHQHPLWQHSSQAIEKSNSLPLHPCAGMYPPGQDMGAQKHHQTTRLPSPAIRSSPGPSVPTAAHLNPELRQIEEKDGTPGSELNKPTVAMLPPGSLPSNFGISRQDAKATDFSNATVIGDSTNPFASESG